MTDTSLNSVTTKKERLVRSFFRFRRYGFAILFILVSFSFYSYLSQFPDPPGANGYFYLKQTESLGDHFDFYFKDRSPAFLLPVVLYKILGSSLEAMRVAIAVTWTALLFGILNLVFATQELGFGKRRRLVLFAATMIAAVASATLIELALHFFKNLFAVTCFIWGCVFLFQSRFISSESWRNKKFFFGVSAFFIALLSHKSMIVLIGAFVCSWMLRKFQLRRFLWVTIGFAALGAVFVIQFERGIQYANALLKSFGGPQLWLKWFGSAIEINRSVALQVGVGISALIYYCIRRKEIDVRARVFADAAFLFAVLAYHPFQAAGPMTAAYRMILISPVFIVPLLLLSLGGKKISVAFGSLLLALQISIPAFQNRPSSDFFPNWSRFDKDVLKIKDFVKPEDHLTSHHGLEFYIDYKTGIRSRSFISENPSQTAYRLVYAPERRLGTGLLKDTIDQTALTHLGHEYVLMSEENWQMVASNTSLGRHWRNPSARRPAHVYE